MIGDKMIDRWKTVKRVETYDICGTKIWGIKRKCTECGFTNIFIEDRNHYMFCPNCGRKMIEDTVTE